MWRRLKEDAFVAKCKAQLPSAAATDYVKTMKILLQLAEVRRVKIVWKTGARSMFIPDRRVIVLNRSSRPKSIVHVLLHELGHLIIDDEARFELSEGMDARSAAERIDTLGEEFKAWHTAEELVEKLRLPIDEDALRRHARWALSRYTAWACASLPVNMVKSYKPKRK